MIWAMVRKWLTRDLYAGEYSSKDAVLVVVDLMAAAMLMLMLLLLLQLLPVDDVVEATAATVLEEQDAKATKIRGGGIVL